MSTEGAAHVECRSFGPPIARVLSTPHGGAIHCRAFSPVLAGKSCPPNIALRLLTAEVVPRHGFSRARVPRSGTGEARAASIIRTGCEERAAKPASLSRYAGEERSGACSGSSTMSPSQCLASARPALAPESYCLVTDATPAAAANARSCFRARRSPEAPPHAPRKPVSP